MTDEFKQLLLRDWAKAAATVVLTRRDDLTIGGIEKELGIDFRVFIDREDDWMRPSFGVLARAIPPTVTTDQANQLLGSTVAEFLGMTGITVPTCLLFFTMREDQGFFSWIDEPTLTEGNSRLVRHDAPDFVPVTKDLLDHVVEKVVAWWVATEPLIMDGIDAHRPGRGHRSSSTGPARPGGSDL